MMYLNTLNLVHKRDSILKHKKINIIIKINNILFLKKDFNNMHNNKKEWNIINNKSV